ncbi:MAG TPA: multicopper oxidase [Ilumatobacteraceae bacterium]|nr:multicopper oxidase [Ilumatobacteraceae bacterium]
MDRRTFIRLTSMGTLGLFVANGLHTVQIGAESIPGGSLPPLDIPKWRTPLLIPPQMPRAGLLLERGGLVDYYEIEVRQFTQQILPAGLPATTVWGYGPARTLSPLAPIIFNAPSLTIEATAGRPVRIKWINGLKDAAGRFLPHLLPVDPTLHWANPPGGAEGRDTRPEFESTPGSYRGPVPMVPHVHGSVGVGDESDGYAEAWYLPAANDIPAEYATVGTWYEFFRGKARTSYRVNWSPGSATFQYPNIDRAGTKWYHDHTLGMTRLNVYAGPAGFYIVRGGAEGDSTVRDSRTGRVAVLPAPAPSEIDQVIPDRTFYEIPIAIQDRAFNADGSLFYPDTRAFFDGVEGPFIPDSDVSPIWNPEFFGNTIMVNGNTWPYLEVEKRRYRLRMLNGCQARFLTLDFSGVPGVEVWQIGNEGGFLAAPVDITSRHANRLLMSPAERADLIVDFTNVPRGNYVLGNLGPDEPFGGGEPGEEFESADPETTGQILQFRVGNRRGVDRSTPARYLRLPSVEPLPAHSVTRPLALIEEMSMFFEDSPAEAVLGTIVGDPNAVPGVLTKRPWMDDVTENPSVGATELWEFYNTTGDAHPMHVHEVLFEVIDRQPIVIDEASGTVRVDEAAPPRPPEDWESGFKDTVTAYPGEVTRIKARFARAGQYVWHCHIVEHEDNEMMRPYRIGPEQPGQPAPHGGHDM